MNNVIIVLVMMGDGDTDLLRQPVVRVGSGPGSTLPTSRFMVFLFSLMWMGSVVSSLPVASHSAPLHSGTIPANYVVRLTGIDCDAVLRFHISLPA